MQTITGSKIAKAKGTHARYIKSQKKHTKNLRESI